MEYPNKIVDYSKYCPICKFDETMLFDEPCDSCMKSPANEHSHTPVNWVLKPGEKDPHYRRGGKKDPGYKNDQ